MVEPVGQVETSHPVLARPQVGAAEAALEAAEVSASSSTAGLAPMSTLHTFMQTEASVALSVLVDWGCRQETVEMVVPDQLVKTALAPSLRCKHG
jgi:hypothetical protein